MPKKVIKEKLCSLLKLFGLSDDKKIISTNPVIVQERKTNTAAAIDSMNKTSEIVTKKKAEKAKKPSAKKTASKKVATKKATKKTSKKSA